MRILTRTALAVSALAAAAQLMDAATARAVPPDYVMLKRCRATRDGLPPSGQATWQIGVPFVSIQLANGTGGWLARHTFEFDTYAFCNGPNGYPEYGTGDDICMGRAANLPGALVYSTVTGAPDALSGSFSLTDSPAGDYAPNMNISATINGSFNLTGYTTITLVYYHHYACRLDQNIDGGRVEVSNDGGTTWTPQIFHAIYTGEKTQFKRAEIDLGPYRNQTLKIRFRFVSNATLQDDGWFIDDVRLTADGTTLFFDDFESGTGAWTLAAPWGLSLPSYSYSTLGSIDVGGVYSTIPVSNPVTIGEGMGFAAIRAAYTENAVTRQAHAQVHHTCPQWKAAPDLGYDDLCPATGQCATTAAGGERAPLRHVVLEQNSPNPFNPTTDIHFVLPAAAAVSLRIYDDAGRLVRVLIDEPAMPAGEHGLTWNGLDAGGGPVRSGIYFYELQVDGRDHTRKMVLLK